MNTKKDVKQNKQMSKTKRTILIVSLSLCITIAFASLGYLGWTFYERYTQNRIEKHINYLFDSVEWDFPEPNDDNNDNDVDDDNNEDDDVPKTPAPETALARERRLLLEKEAHGKELYSDILDVNPDFLGMIEIPGILARQPYVHSSDNSDYLNRNFEGNFNRSGTIFLSALNCRLMTDNISVFYGHYTGAAGTMFTNITRYKQAYTFHTNPIIILDGLLGESKWIVFSAHVTEPTMWYKHYKDDEFVDLIDEIRARSLFDTDVEVTPDDKIITLSVCDYTYENMRFLVHARKLRPDEEAPASVTATVNQNRKDFSIPNLREIEDIDMSAVAFAINPTNNMHFYYQMRAGGVSRFSGDNTEVQGPYNSYYGGIPASAYAAAIIRNVRTDETLSEEEDARGLHIAVQGYDGILGIHLLSGHSARTTLRYERLLTPSGVDARYPVIQTSDTVWLLYSVPGDGQTRFFRQHLNGGNREHVITITDSSTAQFLGYYIIDDAPLVLWFEPTVGWISGAWIGGDSFGVEPLSVNARVTLYGGLRDNNSIRALVNRNGNLSFRSIGLDYLPPKPGELPWVPINTPDPIDDPEDN
ncbi:MAG: class B sortase [Oscillospiraceae bacterium]|jgi:sortase B|nr:class B sortase [Oscillospiraceae bacterium]